MTEKRFLKRSQHDNDPFCKAVASIGAPGKSLRLPVSYTPNPLYKGSRPDEDDGLPLSFGYVQSGLPYSAQDTYDYAEKLTAFDAIVLENDSLKATFISAMGGKLWPLYDQKGGSDLIVNNPMFRPCNLALCNAWTVGGVEWNCGVKGHHPLTCDRIYASVYNGKNGMPVLRLYAFERIRAITYQMDFYLRDDAPFLFARMGLVNGSDMPMPIYWWSTIAVKQEEGARVIVPADEAYVHRIGEPVCRRVKWMRCCRRRSLTLCGGKLLHTQVMRGERWITNCEQALVRSRGRRTWTSARCRMNKCHGIGCSKQERWMSRVRSKHQSLLLCRTNGSSSFGKV